MRTRPSARLLVLDEEGRVLLFRFAFKNGALAGQNFWATPGGALEAGESFEKAAKRELAEETGIILSAVDREVARRAFSMVMPDGETVWADERYFCVRVGNTAISRDGWTALEREVMCEPRWWSVTEILSSKETIFPENLVAMIAALDEDTPRKSTTPPN